ncbi:hypothetical protein [Rhodococcus sp. IEGM 1374]|uniref:hypothetical protein n=1 Tax=Rhodococcus sp. IEGM 1374 TaxID=3082221 RepID=UPI0029549F7F|nr:hypothetical protein [Rhodococcus sp. IEGM 1374]MDV7992081.1 hypothetical protein [Rhodococcus sp. IEGM 1374]
MKADYKTSQAKRDSARLYYEKNKEQIKQRWRSKSAKAREGKRILGQSKLPEYEIWTSMKSRCYSPSNINYERYGGRGIAIFDEWKHSFLAFYEYVGPRPGAAFSLDRIDNDRNYGPGNVRWATRQQQGANTRRRKDNSSGYRGVYKNSGAHCVSWSARVRYDGIDFKAGTYRVIEEAAWMRDQWAIELHGEYAQLNFEYIDIEAGRPQEKEHE